MRSGADCHVNAKRSLSVIHSSLTAGSSPASRRSTTPRRWSMRIARAAGVVLGDAGRRDQVERAATGTGTPRWSARRPGRSARCCRRSSDANGAPGRVLGRRRPAGGARRRSRARPSSNVPICWFAPRFCRSMNASPAISSENRVQRWHRTQRSRSSRICVEIAIGLGNVRLTSTNRVLGAAVAHRLVLQRALAALVAHRAVQRVVDEQQLHDAVLRLVGHRRGVLRLDHHARASASSVQRGLRLRHRRSVAVAVRVPRPRRGTGGRRRPGASSGWSQNRGIWMPSCSAARMTRVPLGTRDLDAVDGEGDQLDSAARPAGTGAARYQGGRRPGGQDRHACTPASVVLRRVGEQRAALRREQPSAGVCVRLELLAEVLHGRRDRAGRRRRRARRTPPEDVVAQVEQQVDVAVACPAPASMPLQHLRQPVRALAARRALAAGLVLVELGPPRHRAHHRGGLVEDLQRARAEHRAGGADATRSRAGRRGARRVKIGVDEPPGVQNFSSWPSRMPPAMSSSSRSVMPSGASYWPGRVTCPDRENSPCPVRLLGAHRREPVRAAWRRCRARTRSTRRCSPRSAARTGPRRRGTAA